MFALSTVAVAQRHHDGGGHHVRADHFNPNHRFGSNRAIFVSGGLTFAARPASDRTL
jgi:hypothetical protein